jgi:ABC-type nitrate/sulfonate/bicarbonate transport system permease component
MSSAKTTVTAHRQDTRGESAHQSELGARNTPARRRDNHALGPKLAGAGLLIVLAVLWEVSVRLNLVVSPSWVPFSDVVRAWTGKVADGSVFVDSVYTLKRMLMGYLIAAVSGVGLGVAMGRSRWIRGLLDPLVQLIRPIPSPAYIPIVILFVGIGDLMKVIVIAIAAFFPILLNTWDGVRAIDPVEIDTGRTLGLRRRSIFMKIVVPSASPFIFSGLRISIAISFIIAILTEMVAGDNGLGYSVLANERNFHVAAMYADIISLAIVGFVLNLIIVRIERIALRWRE